MREHPLKRREAGIINSRTLIAKETAETGCYRDRNQGDGPKRDSGGGVGDWGGGGVRSVVGGLIMCHASFGIL